MKIISIISQKGGSGKTTLAANLAVYASMQKLKVLLIDADPQKSLSYWWEQREEKTPALADVSIKDLEKTIKNLKKDLFDWVIVDTPPHTNETIKSVINISDLILIPVKPSPNDLRAIGNTMSLIKNQNKKFIFVINQANKQANITLSTATELSKYGEVCSSIIANRIDYVTSMISGKTVTEGSKGKSLVEIKDIFNYVKKYLCK